MKLLAAEALKLRTAPRTLLGLVLGLVALVGLGAASTTSAAGGQFRDQMVVWDVLDVAAISTVFTLIVGILIVTWEYRHGTITQTYLASPRRERVIGVKLLVGTGTGAVLAGLAIAVAVAAAVLMGGADVQRGQVELMGRLVLAGALWGALGVGLGAVLQSQLAAIVTAFIWFLVAEPLLTFAVPSSVIDVARYLPGNALDRLLTTGEVESIVGEAAHPYGLWTAGLIALAYAGAMSLAGIAAAVRRDVP